MITIKKYSNRRLYDTEASRYITLEELADRIQAGSDVRVIDAASGDDLTQATLTQIIIESRGAAKLLPVPLLTQMIRLREEALAEFLGRYMTGALELYLQAKQGAQQIAQYNPLVNLPFQAGNAFARLWGGMSPWAEPQRAPEPPPRYREPAPRPPMREPEPPMPPDPHPESQRDDDAAVGRDDDDTAAAAPPPPAKGKAGKAAASSDDVAAMRRELDELKQLIRESAGAKRKK
ncbi:MAG: hypothetical protein IT370_31590 [Deltaproteobacteria bacterium]|nr:hypothetical protein [Deltaproteobacteria bacterium]